MRDASTPLRFAQHDGGEDALEKEHDEREKRMGLEPAGSNPM